MIRNARRRLLKGALASALTAPLWGCAQRSGKTIVRVLHIETNRQVLEVWARRAREFESLNPSAKVEFRVLESATFRARLPTLLQSPEGPHIFYSWGGALVDVQIGAGLLQDITPHVDSSLLAEYMPQALAIYRRDGRYYGLPYLATEIGLLCNADILKASSISIESCSHWGGFLDAIDYLRTRGITPIAAGGMDRWPLALIHNHLALRAGGMDQLSRAMAGPVGAFLNPVYVRATRAYLQLVAMKPFQPGVLAAKAQSALATFLNGGAAFMMHGSWYYRQAAAIKPDLGERLFSKFPLLAFPGLPEGEGNLGTTQAQLNGWLVRSGAPELAIEFLKFFVAAEAQRRLAEGGFIIPAHIGAQDSIAAPALRQIAARLRAMEGLQLEWTTLLGPNGGAAAADAAAALTGGSMNPEQALALIDRGWRIDQSNMAKASG